MIPSYAFLCGVSGAFVVYCLMYRDSRIKDFVESPGERWPVLIVDLFLFLACGGLVAALGVEPRTSKEAFTAGCAWQGLSGGLVAGIELQALKSQFTRRRGRS